MVNLVLLGEQMSHLLLPIGIVIVGYIIGRKLFSKSNKESKAQTS